MDPVANLLKCPAVLQALDHTLAQLRIADQFPFPGAAAGRHQLRGRTIIAVTFGQTGISKKEISFDLSMDSSF